MMTQKSNDYKYFETTADIGIEVTSKTLSDAYMNSALGCMNLITDIDQIKPIITRNIHIVSEDEYGLLYDWITELLVLLDSEDFIASDYEITIKEDDSELVLDATITGDTYNTDIYNYKTEVKAITYHLMEINRTPEGYNIRFIVDL